MSAARTALTWTAAWLAVVLVVATTIWFVIARAGLGVTTSERDVPAARPAVGSSATPAAFPSASPRRSSSAAPAPSAQTSDGPSDGSPAAPSGTSTAGATTSSAPPASSAPSSPTSPRATTIPAPTRTTAAPATPTRTTQPPTRTATKTRTSSQEAGSVTVACTGSDAQLKGASPNPGYQTEVKNSGPQRVEVEFRSDRSDVRIRSECVDGSPTFEVDDHGGGGDGGGDDG